MAFYTRNNPIKLTDKHYFGDNKNLEDKAPYFTKAHEKLLKYCTDIGEQYHVTFVFFKKEKV